MEWAALIAWVLTAGGGFVMLSIWLARGGMRQRQSNRIRPILILSHFLLAATGLVIWIVYIASDDNDTLAWVALAILGVVALLGLTMFALWSRQRGQRGGAAPATTDEPNRPAEQHFPVSIVGVHGLSALTTIALVFLTAIGVGD